MKKIPLHLLFLSCLLPLSISTDTITTSTSLREGQTLISDGGNFALGFFSPGNSRDRYLGIWYNKVSVQTVVWVANRRIPIPGRTGYLNFSSNGDLTLYNQSADVVWSAGSLNLTSPTAQLLDNGNLVLGEETDSSGSFSWQSFDYPCDTLLPGMKLGLNLKTGLDRYLTTWYSADDPSPGDYSFRMDPQGSPEVLLWHGLKPLYRNGPWNGIQFSGEPEMKSDDIFTFNFTANQEEVYYMFQIMDPSVVSRFVLNQSMIQRYVWFASKGEWHLYWSMPRDQCDYYGSCGVYGVCNSNDSPICECLDGFVPKLSEDWKLRDFSGGCERRTRLDCPSGDGFRKMEGMKLPDTSNSTVDKRMSLEQCRVRCLNTCSCTAYASANINEGGSGCVIWTDELMDLRQFVDGGQDLYIRLAASELESSNKKKNVAVIFIMAIACGILLLGLTGWCIWKQRIKNYGRRNRLRQMSFELSFNTSGPATEFQSDNESNRGKALELPTFDMDSIVIATDNFSNVNKLGEGGFGTVYKGDLRDGQYIAVKRLSKTSLQGIDEFKNEVLLIAKLQHINLVRLLGCSIHGEERMLVYEYMHNRSLDTFIFDKTKSTLLAWHNRFNIIMGIARGLLYLHQDSRLRIVHRDLKASNILLDTEMNPKISDFGVARIFGGDQTGDHTKRVVGTYGYMSPEYAMDGIFSVKSDVFSFGVLLLEIISGKRNRGIYCAEPQLNLLGYAWRLWKEGNILELVDKSLGTDYPISEVLRCIQVGLLCVQERAEDRPQISIAILMLSSPAASLPQPKQPGFYGDRSFLDAEFSSSSTSNAMTITVIEGR